MHFAMPRFVQVHSKDTTCTLSKYFEAYSIHDSSIKSNLMLETSARPAYKSKLKYKLTNQHVTGNDALCVVGRLAPFTSDARPLGILSGKRLHNPNLPLSS